VSQSTRRQATDKLRSLDKDPSLPFTEILDARMVEDALAAEGVTYNRSIYTPFVTLCTFLSHAKKRFQCQEKVPGTNGTRISL
jgi:hypothetical protein